ncbi:hypothetical protein [Nitrospira sp. KM1]|uniref:hypothetical protein n=1 Tax=Nitrospira sp. KM1 TaxID=1936990 RepID=UPI001562F8C4|nr:hypothetical protein [Nitrospira sp. KM1]
MKQNAFTSISVIHSWLMPIAGLAAFILCVPFVIGYANGHWRMWGAVSGVSATCLPGWSLTRVYAQDGMLIPVADLQRYLTESCPDDKPRYAPTPDQFIKNELFHVVRRHVDAGYFIGFRAAEHHVMDVMVPAWNWTFMTYPWMRSTVVPVLVFVTIGCLACLGYLFARVL